MKHEFITLMLSGQGEQENAVGKGGPQHHTDSLSLIPGIHIAGEDWLIPESCSLTSTCVQWHAHMFMHMPPPMK